MAAFLDRWIGMLGDAVPMGTEDRTVRRVVVASVIGFGLGVAVHQTICWAQKVKKKVPEPVPSLNDSASEQQKSSIESNETKLAPADILSEDMDPHLSPGNNAIVFLQDLMKENQSLSYKDRARLEFAISIFQSSSWQSLTVPTVLASETDNGEDENLDVETREWLRATFTGLSGPSTQKVRSMKALGTGVVFAMRLKRHVSTLVESLPYDVADVAKRKEIEAHLLKATNWDFDIWRLKELTDGRELQTLGWYVLQQSGLAQHFGLEKPQLKKWLASVESEYTDTAYHSATHAADVLAGVYFMLVTAGARKLISKIEELALILAAIIHDAGHDGMNNNYHKNAMSDRAVAFNDQSIQENYHVSLIFQKTLNDPTMNIFNNFNKEQQVEVRKLLIKLVLDTDMSRHFTNMAAFTADIAEKGSDPDKWSTSTEAVCCIVLHLCDISNPARPLEHAKKWAELVTEEFYAQGDKEIEQELPVSPNCKRGSDLATGQIGFITYIVLPFFKVAGDMLPSLNLTVMPVLQSNLEYWKRLQDPVSTKQRRASLVPGPRSPIPRAVRAPVTAVKE
mmetsp:Transcript_22543/g.45578  ORF Transcript_22543/g.45578 Transcript_22543/m.45578 type:complete len:566 (-) Transcript_22543:477-2174(-)